MTAPPLLQLRLVHASSPARRRARRIGVLLIMLMVGWLSVGLVGSRGFSSVCPVRLDEWPARLTVETDAEGDWRAARTTTSMSVTLPASWPEGDPDDPDVWFDRNEQQADVEALLPGSTVRIVRPDTGSTVEMTISGVEMPRFVDDAGWHPAGAYWPALRPGVQWHASGVLGTIVARALMTLWLSLIPTMILVHFTADYWWWRKLDGHCWKCGYDLRGSEGACPECGAERRY